MGSDPGTAAYYLIGGRHNLAADREFAERVLQVMPSITDVARLNQAFVRRAALFMVSSGVRQFIDLGSGIPTVEHVHEIVQRADPRCRMVYVDHDPIAVAHSALLFEPIPGIGVIQESLDNADAILNAEQTRTLLDLAEPIGLIAPAVHFILDHWNAANLTAGYRDRLAPGSYLVVAHLNADAQVPGLTEAATAYQRTRYPVCLRSHTEIMTICAGDLVWPGLVGYALWRPQGPDDVSTTPEINSVLYAAVGRKP